MQQITENPYLQYFIGLPGFQEREPFHPSLMTHFRKRLGENIINKVHEWIAIEKQTKDSQDTPDDDDPSNGSSSSDETDSTSTKYEPSINQGKLLLDASCAPAGVAYPADLELLNEAWEKLESLIDALQCSYAPQTHRSTAEVRRMESTKYCRYQGTKRPYVTQQPAI